MKPRLDYKKAKTLIHLDLIEGPENAPIVTPLGSVTKDKEAAIAALCTIVNAPTRPSPSEEALVERLAAIEHERWSGWMRHLFNKSSKGINAQGEIVEAIIPEWACRRWMRQMDTPYADLTEEEKESDRVEVRKTLAALSSSAPVSEAKP